MRLLLVPALALVFAGVPAVQAGDDVVAPITATLEKNSRVRFGPSTSAKEIVTLKAGSTVEVFGPSKSSPEWYVVRFPKEGRVWIHSKNLKQLDGGERYIVTQDKTRARNDSTLSADVVAELNQGEVVIDKGVVNGDWRAVNIPDAVGYVHKNLVNMPKDAEAQMTARAQKAAAAAQTWETALATYARYVETVKASPKAAVGLDWAGLAAQLDIVIVDHASASVRLAAKRVRESIEQVVKPAIELAPQLNQPAPRPIGPAAQQPVATAPAGQTAPTGQTAPAAPAGEAAAPMSDEQMRALLNAQADQAKRAQWNAEGILVQDDAYMAKVGTRDTLTDGDGNVVAFIKAKDGVDLKLSELLWREVGAKGETLMVPPEQSGLAKPTKLIVATDVAPVR